MSMYAKLVLEDGSEFTGRRFGADASPVTELVFNTSMVGYQEIISDPSYTGQTVVMTYPLIGNYGMAEDDYETKRPTIGGLIVHEYNDEPSNFRSAKTLSQVMEDFGIPGIQGIDTRKLGRIIRSRGSCKALIADASESSADCLARLRSAELPRDSVSRVSVKARRDAFVLNSRFHIAAIDCGMKENIVRSLNALGCSVSILPWNTTAEEIRALRPDGLFLSNGPGDPEDLAPVIDTIRDLRGSLPIFGICLGHQLLCLAYGAKTYKLKFGHRGGNHPVRNLATGRIEITSQNHSYAVDEASLSATPLAVTHRNLLDGTVEGVACPADRVFSVQYHPESAPGPQDSAYLFSKFIDLMEESKDAKKN
ncbi:MAG: glutamine-hydrolyzing carbamoyl-phosphate synthase small subunit [Candidatus Heteroscillospira sp.]|jgi:carbamoyl-phosphate synthase small subunit